MSLDRVRLHLTSSAATPSQVDGAWWPRSTDLTAELPALLVTVRGRTGPVVVVGYHRDVWDPAADEAVIAGERVRLEAFTDDEPHSVLVIGSSGRRLTLVVVPPDMVGPPGTSDDELLAELVAPPGPGPAPSPNEDEDRQRWLRELIARLAPSGGRTDERRTRTVERWADEAARQFIDAPVQAYVPILAEHIVREQIGTSDA